MTCSDDRSCKFFSLKSIIALKSLVDMKKKVLDIDDNETSESAIYNN